MTANECAKAWLRIKEIYNETRDKTPKDTAEQIVKELGKETAYIVFATITRLKKGDGRIYGRNRKVMESHEYVPEATVWNHSNPMIGTGLDDIHTTHINQMIGALIDMG